MSGRVRWRRDGEVVTGFRKTDRRQTPARPLVDRLHDIGIQGAVANPAARPEIRMVFLLPASLQGFVASGEHGAGVMVLARGFVRITSWSAEQCFIRAQGFLRDVAKDRPAFTLTAVIISMAKPEERYGRHLTVVRGAMVVSVASPVEPAIFEAA